MEVLVLLVLVATIVATPLTFCPLKMLDGYILPQIAVGALGMSLATVLFLSLGIFPVNLVSIMVCLYFFYLLLTAFWSTVPHNSLRELPLVFSYMAIFIVSLALFTQGGMSNLVLLSLAVFFVSMCTSLYGLGQRLKFDPLFKLRLKPVEEYKNKPLEEVPSWFRNKERVDTRPISTIGNTTFFGGYLVATLPFLVLLSVEVNSWFWFSVLIAVFTIAVTKSRASILGVLLGVVFFLLLASYQGWVFDFLFCFFGQLGFVPMLLLALLVAFIGGWVLVKARHSPLLKRLHEKSPLTMKLSVEGTDQQDFLAHLRYRFRYWRAAFELIRQRPLQGFGLRTYRKEVYQAQAKMHERDKKFLGLGYQTPQPREVHNDFIENFVESGIVGGVAFLLIIGVVIYHAMSFFVATTNSHQQILVAAFTSSVVGLLVNALFFFPFRLASSALPFWMALAAVEFLAGKGEVMFFESNVAFSFLLSGALAAMLWEGCFKPNAGNWFFRKYSFADDQEAAEKYLMKAIECCPHETIYRTHAMMGYLEAYPDYAEKHANVMREFYDGMTPAWVMFYNAGLVKAANKKWTEAMENFNHSLYYYPRFLPAAKYIEKIWPKAPLPQQRVKGKRIGSELLKTIQSHRAKQREYVKGKNEILDEERRRLGVPTDWVYDSKRGVFISKEGKVKQLSQEAMNNIRLQQSEIEKLQLVIENIILQEKIRMNIPLDWMCSLEEGIFLSPKEFEQYKKGHSVQGNTEKEGKNGEK